MTYAALRNDFITRFPDGEVSGGVRVDDILQLRIQNTYDTHLDIARAGASVVRVDMAAYDADPSKFTQSPGCWSGFHARQMVKAGVSVELVRVSRFHDGSGTWGDQMIPLVRARDTAPAVLPAPVD